MIQVTLSSAVFGIHYKTDVTQVITLSELVEMDGLKKIVFTDYLLWYQDCIDWLFIERNALLKEKLSWLSESVVDGFIKNSYYLHLKNV